MCSVHSQWTTFTKAQRATYVLYWGPLMPLTIIAPLMPANPKSIRKIKKGRHDLVPRNIRYRPQDQVHRKLGNKIRTIQLEGLQEKKWFVVLTCKPRTRNHWKYQQTLARRHFHRVLHVPMFHTILLVLIKGYNDDLTKCKKLLYNAIHTNIKGLHQKKIKRRAR